MDESMNHDRQLSTKIKIFGTMFLVLQLLLAANNYGPHNIPGLSLLFDEPWIPAEEVSLQQAMYGRTANFTFEDITKSSGLNSFYRAKVNGANPSYLEVMSGGLAIGDVDGDGTFTDIAASARVNEVKSSMGIVAADFGNTGNPGLVISNLEGSYVSLFRNMGDLRFDYATHYSGLNPSRRSSGWGLEFTDLDLDGNLDLVIAAGPVWDTDPKDAENLFFKNNGNGGFEDQTLMAGDFRNSDVSRGLAVIDIQNNGRPDLVISNIDGGTPQVLMNTTINGNNWLKLTLEGTESNRDAIGAKVTVHRTDGRTIYRAVKAGGSYQSSGTKSLFIGLEKTTIDQLIIDWPSGHSQVLTDVPINTSLHVVEHHIQTDSSI